MRERGREGGRKGRREREGEREEGRKGWREKEWERGREEGLKERKLGDPFFLCMVGRGLFYRKKKSYNLLPSSSGSPDKNTPKKTLLP